MMGKRTMSTTTRIMERSEMKRDVSKVPHPNMYSLYSIKQLPTAIIDPMMMVSAMARATRLIRSLDEVPGPVGHRISKASKAL